MYVYIFFEKRLYYLKRLSIAPVCVYIKAEYTSTYDICSIFMERMFSNFQQILAPCEIASIRRFIDYCNVQ
jgi:hypothetical protein